MITIFQNNEKKYTKEIKMTGIQFKIIRMARKISAKRIANKLGFKSKSLILNYEKKSDIQLNLISVLEALTGLELTDEAKVETIVIESTQQFTKLDRRNTIWQSKYKEELINVS